MIPSISTRVWLASAPRMRTSVKPPSAPERLTATPGTSRSTSDTTTVWRCCIAWSSITVTEAGTRSAGVASPEREALTTSTSTGVGGACWARAASGLAQRAASAPAPRVWREEAYRGIKAPLRLPASERQAESLQRGGPHRRRVGGADADARRPTGRNGSPPLLLVAQTEFRASDSTDPKARATRTDRFPGSRVIASYADLPGPFGPVAGGGFSSPAGAYALAAHSCRDSHGSAARRPLPAFPIKPRRHRRAFTGPRLRCGRRCVWSRLRRLSTYLPREAAGGGPLADPGESRGKSEWWRGPATSSAHR